MASRWKAKLFAKAEEAFPKHDKDDEVKKPTRSKSDDDADLNAFLKPSTDKAQQAAAAFVRPPRLDTGAAQRWPSSKEILTTLGSAGRSPGPGGLSTGRKKGLSVSFVRQVPDIIGFGGEEYDEPAAEVSKRKKSGNGTNVGSLQPHQDDANLGAGVNRTPSLQEQRSSLTRTKSSGGELSPPLGKKLEMGNINSYVQPPPPLPQGMGHMGLGMRPKPLSRTATGFDSSQLAPTDRRPSVDSEYSQESDMSPLARKITNVEPTIQEESDENFRPKALARTQTGFHNVETAPGNEPVLTIPAVPRLPDMRAVGEDYSPLDAKTMLAEQYVQREPTRTDSSSARARHRMRAEEGKTLHQSAQRQDSHDSENSIQSERPLQVETPPAALHASPTHGRVPQGPRALSPRASPTRRLEAEDPYRSRSRGPSPARHAMPPGTFPLDTDTQPSSSGSSHYTLPSAASYARTSPSMRSEPFSATVPNPVQRMPSNGSHAPMSALPPQFQQRTNLPPPTQVPQQLQPPPTQVPQQLQPPSPQVPQQLQPPSPRFAPRLLPPSQQAAPLNGQLPVRTGSDARQRDAVPLSRSDTRTLGETAYRDFGDRITHMRGIFSLTAQFRGPLYERSPRQWLRAITWFFLKGRAAMEAQIRNQSKDSESQSERLTQAHVDLAKVMWIIEDVLPNHPGIRQYGGTLEAQLDLAKKSGDGASAEAFEIQAAILHYLRQLMGSIKKHQSMPPTQALIQGQDQSIWVEYPQFAPDAASVLQAGIPKPDVQPAWGLSSFIPLADTKSDFCYFRMFVKASMTTDDSNTDRVPMTAVISVLRPKDQYQVKLAICSQSELINIILGPGTDNGPTWDEVNWKKQSNQISIHLRHGFTITLELSENDWRSLFSIVDHTNRVQTDLREKRDERIACKLQLREASSGKRKLHRGYRMVLATPKQSKQMSLINHELGTKQAPMNFEYVTEADNAPAMRLHFREETPDKKARTCTVHLVFQEAKDRNSLFGTLTSMNIAPGEMAFAQVPLKAYHIESADQAEGFSQQGSRVLDKLQWQEAKVINQDAEAAGLESAPVVLSESLRIVCRHSAGIIADRMNLGVY
jgi:hypothetical protein